MEPNNLEAVKNQVAVSMGFKSYMDYLVQYEESPFVPALEKFAESLMEQIKAKDEANKAIADLLSKRDGYVAQLEENAKQDADLLDIFRKHERDWETAMGNACGCDTPQGAAKYITNLQNKFTTWQAMVKQAVGTSTPEGAVAEVLRLKSNLRKKTAGTRMVLVFLYGFTMVAFGVAPIFTTANDHILFAGFKAALAIYLMYTGFRWMGKSFNTYS